MIISSFFNKEQKALMITSISKSKKQEVEKNVYDDFVEVKIYDEEKNLVSLNLIGSKFEYLNPGIVNNESIMDIIQNYFKEDIKSPYIVGQIKDIKKHPKSQKLNICQVDIGSQIVQIVCGAKNVEQNIKVIVAQVGAVMPNGLEILPSTLVGEESNGMITSLFELGLSDQNTNKIAILDQNLKVGAPYYG